MSGFHVFLCYLDLLFRAVKGGREEIEKQRKDQNRLRLMEDHSRGFRVRETAEESETRKKQEME